MGAAGKKSRRWVTELIMTSEQCDPAHVYVKTAGRTHLLQYEADKSIVQL